MEEERSAVLSASLKRINNRQQSTDLWPTFPLQNVYVYLQLLLRNLPRKLPNSMKLYAAVRVISLLHRSKSSKVTEFGNNRKLICNFLLVIYTNSAHILHRFRDIATSDRSKIAIFCYTSSV